MTKTVRNLIIVVLVVAVGLTTYLIVNNGKKPTQIANDTSISESAADRQSDANAKLLDAALKVYYLNNDASYPFDIKQLTEFIHTYQPDNQAFKIDLDNLEYSVRGDRGAYKYTYTDAKGQKITHSGEYEKDYTTR